MNKAILQLWEESNSNEGFLSNGCSIHLNLSERNSYIAEVYKDRNSEVPDQYDRIVGECIEVFVNDEIYNLICQDKSVKVPESAFQNLLKFEEIIVNKATV